MAWNCVGLGLDLIVDWFATGLGRAKHTWNMRISCSLLETLCFCSARSFGCVPFLRVSFSVRFLEMS